MPQAIHISPIDNVVVALHPIAKGTLVEVDGLAVTALEDIPQGHKMAVKPIKNGENVIKYGFPIGHATADAEPGTWMHTHNVHTNLSGEVEYSYNPAPDLAPLPKVEPETFMGFRRKDGRAAIRNEADNGLKNKKYTIAMARTGEPHSATAQFFINTKDNDFLDFKSQTPQGWGYAVFGKVIKGQEVVDKIAAVMTGKKGYYDDVPRENVIIKKAVVVE